MKTGWIRLACIITVFPIYAGAIIVGVIIGIFRGAFDGLCWIDRRLAGTLDDADEAQP